MQPLEQESLTPRPKSWGQKAGDLCFRGQATKGSVKELPEVGGNQGSFLPGVRR